MAGGQGRKASITKLDRMILETLDNESRHMTIPEIKNISVTIKNLKIKKFEGVDIRDIGRSVKKLSDVNKQWGFVTTLERDQTITKDIPHLTGIEGKNGVLKRGRPAEWYILSLKGKDFLERGSEYYWREIAYSRERFPYGIERDIKFGPIAGSIMSNAIISVIEPGYYEKSKKPARPR